MTMVQIGQVRVAVRHRLVLVRMRMRPARIPGRIVLVLVVRVVPMPMIVRQGFVAVLMLMAFGQHQKRAQCHHQQRREQPP